MTSQPAHIWWLSPFSPETATGLYYYRRRWYDAGTGGMISPDPLGFAAGDANLYRYCGNSPLSYTDPSGLFASGSGYGGIWDGAAAGGDRHQDCSLPAGSYAAMSFGSDLWLCAAPAEAKQAGNEQTEPVPEPAIDQEYRNALKSLLPNIEWGVNTRVLSGVRDPDLNCIASARGKTGNIAPITDAGPNPFGSMDKMFAEDGYKVSAEDCAKDPKKAFSLEAGKEKLVLYATSNADGSVAKVTHAANQLEDGWWKSKLGVEILVKHNLPAVLDSKEYGRAVRVYERPIPQPPKN
jgi:RHS repeat-associated protein